MIRGLLNRITLSLVIIFILVWVWEFYVKPETSPLYTEAVAQYRNKNYDRSLELLQTAYDIDPNNTAILTLMGWDHLKKGDAKNAEPYFERAHKLSPRVLDLLLGYAYTEISLKKYETAAQYLNILKQNGVDNPDVHVAWATLYREVGRNQEAAREFQLALAMDSKNAVAIKNLKEILSVSGDVNDINLSFQPIVRPPELAYPARVNNEKFDWKTGNEWKPVYMVGVGLTASLPGHYPSDATVDTDLYDDWFQKMNALGINTIRVYSILPPAFYRSLYQYNHAGGHPPLHLLQGIVLDDPPLDDFFNHDYYAACQKEIRTTIDVLHGQGDVPAMPAHGGGLYPNDVSEWTAGIIIGKEWLSHVVTGNNQFHPDMRNYQGAYIEVPSGSATEVFLAQMVNLAAEYEETKYNWQHPVAFLNWPTLDPLHHPTESTILEEVSIRRGLGEHVPTPDPPYDDDDSVTVDPTHLHATDRLKAGYFAAYSVVPYYPDFLNYDPRYQTVRDSEGGNSFFGYLKDLKAHQAGIPLVIVDYGVPSSRGVGHFNPGGLDQGGKTERQQGEILARMTRNIYDAGGAGGFIFEWLDQWFRQTWLVRNFEVPMENKLLWKNPLDPAEYSGLVAAQPGRREVHRLGGDPAEWENKPAVYSKTDSKLFQPQGDRYDSARNLKSLYADADEAYLYLRLVVQKLDNDNDGQPDWKDANYLIGVSTLPDKAGLQYLPFIAPVRFPMGMTYAIQIAGPEFSHIWIASSYDPYQVFPVEGIPAQSALGLKLGWKPSLTENGTFESQIVEPNRRRFARNGKYFSPQRYDRGILRYGSLDPASPDYDSLAEWHANVRTNTIDIRIPWGLLGVTDPSTFRVFAGIERDGTVTNVETPHFLMTVFSYRPLENARMRPIMEQGHVISDALPGMTGPATVLSAGYQYYRWPGWTTPEYSLRLKDSYVMLRKAIQALPAAPAAAAVTHPRTTQQLGDRGPEPSGKKLRAGK
jgi:tetratricopeptide (TPR) repeat protein